MAMRLDEVATFEKHLKCSIGRCKALCVMRDKIKLFLNKEFSHFNGTDFWPGENWTEAITIFLAWVIPSCLFVIWSNTYYPEVKFYQKAITEGLGPNLWNAIGSFGFLAFGVAVVFSHFSAPRNIAYTVLSNTYGIGCLTFGLLLGQWFTLLPNTQLVWWKVGLFGITSAFLLIIFFFYNLAIWYLSFLLKSNKDNQKSIFLDKLEKMHWLWRIGIGVSLVAIIIVIFLSES